MPSSHSSSNDTDAYVNDSTHFNDTSRKYIWRVGIIGENVTDLLASVNYIRYM